MAQMLILWLAALCVLTSGEFHVHSRVQYEGARGSDFGFALAYQKSHQKLFVGTPRVDLDGGVDACPIWSYGMNKSCNNILHPNKMKNIWGEFSRDISPNQHFLLGATVAATPDYWLACAPIFTIKWQKKNPKTKATSTTYPAIGRCFIQNDTHGPSVLTNPIEKTATGSCLGWSAMVDEANDTLLISKPTGMSGTFMYTRVSSPGSPLARANLTLTIDSQEIKDGRYIGLAMTSGVFFSNIGKIYAIAWEDTSRDGYVGFLHLENGTLKALARSERKLFIKCKRGLNMFGASLHMADFSGDLFSELVVGAPAEPYRDEYEAGAIYIYRGGYNASQEITVQTATCIHHNKAGSRFGTALASLDLDGDDLPELFISAPYKANGGAVYVVSGAKVRALLENGDDECKLLKQYYQILSSEHKSFGFVLQPALNFDDNGGNVLAVGAPLVDKVFLYRSIPAMKVEISVKLKDKEIVRELDKNFTVTVNISINYPAKQKKSSGYLFVETSITTDLNRNRKPSAVPDINKNDQTFKIDLSKREKQVSRDIVVKMKDDLPHTYNFLAIVKSNESRLDNKEFSESLIRLSDNSKYNLRILRRCRGDECVPRLTMALKWSQSSDDYILGSSLYETVTVAIKNDGNSSYESCAKVNIAGAKIADWSCDVREIKDICRFQELKGSAEHSLTIKLDMSRVSYRRKELDVSVSLYSKCSDEKPTKTDHKTIKYTLNTDEIIVTGSYFPLNVTDRDIADTTSYTVGLLETFTITNNCSVVWEELQTEIKILKQPYIQDFVILNQDNINCLKWNDTDFIKYNCAVNLDAKSYIQLKTQVNIAKNAVVNNLKEEKLLIFNTDINVNLSSTDHKNFSLDATAMYCKDLTFKNHKVYIIIVAILLSIIVLLIIAFILYKCGFFERNTKKELNELKNEWKRRSTIRRPESAYQSMNEGELVIEEEHEENEANSCTTENPKSS